LSKPEQTAARNCAMPTSVIDVRERLEAAGHYVSIDRRLTEQTAATLVPCPFSRLRRWRLDGKGPRYFQPAKTPWYYLGDVPRWITQGESLR